MDNLSQRMGRGEDILAQFEAQYHNQIPDHAYHLEAISRKMYWVRCVYNVQGKARELGLIENPSRGLWRLTEKGHNWLLDHPEETHFTGESANPNNSGGAKNPGIQKIHHLSSDLETQSTCQNRFKIFSREISSIQSYLHGNSPLQLSDEKLCDWVYFCYTFEMYTEGRDLFVLIDPNEVHSWYYERTRKLAKLCELRA